MFDNESDLMDRLLTTIGFAICLRMFSVGSDIVAPKLEVMVGTVSKRVLAVDQ